VSNSVACLPERRMQQQPLCLGNQQHVQSIRRKGGCNQRSSEQLSNAAGCLLRVICKACRAALSTASSDEEASVAGQLLRPLDCWFTHLC
jgi:hypothetical protein